MANKTACRLSSQLRAPVVNMRDVVLLQQLSSREERHVEKDSEGNSEEIWLFHEIRKSCFI